MSAGPPDGEPLAAIAQASVPPGQAKAGEKLFNKAFPHTNGRHCGTCHVKEEHLALSPANVEARFAANPNELLFHPIDADNPTASPLTFNNLRQGLVRVKVRLADNLDLIQVPPIELAFAPSGLVEAWWNDNVVLGSRLGDPLPPGKLPEIITPADRMIELWRAVPSVENTAISSPFLYDGRETDLADQALGALINHSQLTGSVGNGKLELVAQFQRTLFTSDRAKSVAQQLEAGIPLDSIPKPETNDPAFAVGQDVYEQFCTACHGKATDSRVENEGVRAGVIFEVDHQGNTLWQIINGIPVATNAPRPGNEFLNIGTTIQTYFGQITKGFPPNPLLPATNKQADFPRYRLRFYTNGSRTTQVADLPPLMVHDPNNPFAAPARPDGSLIAGPNFVPQLWTTDPGRAVITGDYADFEAFNIPQLRGIANTAPYFHDNMAADLTAVVDIYSQFILPFIPILNPTNIPGGQHVISAADRAALVQFLSHF
ncbi:MAG: cytochrome-c peroxidase [Polyangiaceae bacterium]